MRILIADHDVQSLAALAATFGEHCDLVTATGRDECLGRIEREQFDVIVACDRLAGYTGLELLSDVASASPGTLRIFAATPSRLELLANRLDFFGLFSAVAYPIDPLELVSALLEARRGLPTLTPAPEIRHVVLEEEWDTGARHFELPMAPGATVEITSVEDVPVWGAAGTDLDVGINLGAGMDEPAEANAVAEVPEATDPGAAEWAFAENQVAKDDDEIEDASAIAVVVAEEVTPAPGADAATVEATPGESEPPQSPSEADEAAANDPLFSEASAAPGNDEAASTAMEGHSQHIAPPPQQPPAKSAQASQLPAQQSQAAAQLLAQPALVSAAPTLQAAPLPGAAGKVPRQRAASVPTASQRAAFERALARRNAARTAGDTAWTGDSRPVSLGNQLLGRGNEAADSANPALPFKSLAELARAATAKRPLRQLGVIGKTRSWRAALIGSAIAAVFLVGLLSLHLLKGNAATEHAPGSRVASAQLFGPAPSSFGPSSFGNSSGNAGSAQQPEAAVPDVTALGPADPPGSLFNPDTAPSDPTPPPALEQAGSAELAPSMAHVGPPLGLQHRDSADSE